jgi:hypothetical protein
MDNNTINNSNTFNNSTIGNFSGGKIQSNLQQPQTLPSLNPHAEMAKKTQQFDVCIVCALSQEAKAVINEFSHRCDGLQFKRTFSRATGYEYQYATINNYEEEPLNVLVMSMPFTGPIETVNSGPCVGDAPPRMKKGWDHALEKSEHA